MKYWCAYLEISELEESIVENNWMRIKEVLEVMSLWKYTASTIECFFLNKDNKTRKDLRFICHKRFQPLEPWTDE